MGREVLASPSIAASSAPARMAGGGQSFSSSSRSSEVRAAAGIKSTPRISSFRSFEIKQPSVYTFNNKSRQPISSPRVENSFRNPFPSHKETVRGTSGGHSRPELGARMLVKDSYARSEVGRTPITSEKKPMPKPEELFATGGLGSLPNRWKSPEFAALQKAAPRMEVVRNMSRIKLELKPKEVQTPRKTEIVNIKRVPEAVQREVLKDFSRVSSRLNEKGSNSKEKVVPQVTTITRNEVRQIYQQAKELQKAKAALGHPEVVRQVETGTKKESKAATRGLSFLEQRLAKVQAIKQAEQVLTQPKVQMTEQKKQAVQILEKAGLPATQARLVTEKMTEIREKTAPQTQPEVKVETRTQEKMQTQMRQVVREVSPFANTSEEERKITQLLAENFTQSKVELTEEEFIKMVEEIMVKSQGRGEYFVPSQTNIERLVAQKDEKAHEARRVAMAQAIAYAFDEAEEKGEESVHMQKVAERMPSQTFNPNVKSEIAQQINDTGYDELVDNLARLGEFTNEDEAFKYGERLNDEITAVEIAHSVSTRGASREEIGRVVNNREEFPYVKQLMSGVRTVYVRLLDRYRGLLTVDQEEKMAKLPEER